MTEEKVLKSNEVELEVIDDLFLNPDDSIVEDVPVSAEEVPVTPAAVEVMVDNAALAEMEAKLLAVEKERDDFKNRMMRAAADLENFRRRANREKEELRKYGIDKLVAELLPVTDNFERALEHSDDTASFVDGIQMIYKQFINSLEKHGVKGFEAVGEKFLPQLHEAIQQVETDEQEPGHVVAQFQKGYHLHDRLVRAALVSVAKAVTEKVETPEAEVAKPTGDEKPVILKKANGKAAAVEQPAEETAEEVVVSEEPQEPQAAEAKPAGEEVVKTEEKTPKPLFDEDSELEEQLSGEKSDVLLKSKPKAKPLLGEISAKKKIPKPLFDEESESIPDDLFDED